MHLGIFLIAVYFTKQSYEFGSKPFGLIRTFSLQRYCTHHFSYDVKSSDMQTAEDALDSKASIINNDSGDSALVDLWIVGAGTLGKHYSYTTYHTLQYTSSPIETSNCFSCSASYLFFAYEMWISIF
ncbi:hypothetical protein EON65_57985 [archaeon]|nr:MAG: hypothetical protein EON65_57985 [archaeon]